VEIAAYGEVRRMGERREQLGCLPERVDAARCSALVLADGALEGAGRDAARPLERGEARGAMAIHVRVRQRAVLAEDEVVHLAGEDLAEWPAEDALLALQLEHGLLDERLVEDEEGTPATLGDLGAEGRAVEGLVADALAARVDED